MSTRLDHVSFGVRDARAWAAELRRAVGATPVAGEVLRDFRWVMFYLGTTDAGGHLEIIQPEREGFLSRFLDEHGEGPHHLTFMVDDLRDTVSAVRDLGLTVVGENYGFAPWEEAFVYPDGRLGVVVQLAQSTRRYPDAAELLASRDRHPDHYPASRGAQDLNWWSAVWDERPGPHRPLIHTELASTEPAFVRTVFEGALGATRTSGNSGETDVYSWPGGTIHVLTRTGESGVKAVRLAPNSPALTIGRTPVGPGEPLQ